MTHRTPSSETPTLAGGLANLRRLFWLVRPYWGSLVKAVSLGVVVSAIGLASPFLTKMLIDDVYPSGDVTLMHVLVGGILAIGLSTSIIGAIRGYFVQYVNAHLNNAVSLLFFDHIQRLPVRFFEGGEVGEITSRFGDVSSSLSTVSRVINLMFNQGFYLLVVPPILLVLEWRLAAIALISIPLTTAVITWMGRAIRKRLKQTSEAYADLSGLQVEMLTRVRTVKSLALEDFVASKMEGKIKGAIREQLRSAVLLEGVRVSNAFIVTTNNILIVWVAWGMILSEALTLGSYIAFMAYIGYFRQPISEFLSMYSEFQSSTVSLHRMYEYLDKAPEQSRNLPTMGRQADRVSEGEVVFDGVHFAYEPDNAVLRGVDLTIPAGQTTAIVGLSGSGKTSLLRLVTRIERPTDGRVLIDGRNVEAFDLAALRRQVSVVWQEDSLLKGTIRENVTIGVEEVTDAEVERACRIAQIHEFISGLPSQYETSVSESGINLSGGQRQRIAIARAIVRAPQVLVLDESTANVDVVTEEAIFDRLFHELGDTTILFVTHRVGSASRADRVCVMADGQIVGFGPHEQVLEECSVYREMLGVSGRGSVEDGPAGDGAAGPVASPGPYSV